MVIEVVFAQSEIKALGGAATILFIFVDKNIN